MSAPGGKWEIVSDLLLVGDLFPVEKALFSVIQYKLKLCYSC